MTIKTPTYVIDEDIKIELTKHIKYTTAALSNKVKAYPVYTNNILNEIIQTAELIQQIANEIKNRNND